MKLKKTFVQGKMNKDIDERLLPDGQYPHAENIRVSNTNSSDVGAVENVMGNQQLTSFNLKNAKTIGVFSDDSNQKIYWFVTSENKDLVIEYDFYNLKVNILLESSNVLNFDKNYLITGVVKIINGDFNKDLLIWTDNLNPPRIINIERAKTYGMDNFEEDDISLIKKPPRFAPKIQLTFTPLTIENNLENKFLSFAYRYKYLDGEYSALSSFSNPSFAPRNFNLDFQTFENKGMVNSFNAVNIVFDTGDSRVTDIELVFKESNSNTIYVIETLNKKEERWKNNEKKYFQFSNSKIYSILPKDEIFRLYDNVPRRAKALELIGNRIVFGNYVEGYDLINIFDENINIDYEISTINNNLLDKELPTSLNTDKNEINIDLKNIPLKEDTRLTFSFVLKEANITLSGHFNDSFYFILNKNYSDAKELATSDEFKLFVETIMTNKFLQNYTTTPPDDSKIEKNTPFKILSSTSTSITISSPTITYKKDLTPADLTDASFGYVYRNWIFVSDSTAYYSEISVATSLKTNRSYEVGIVYMDEYGRATTVLTDNDNTVYISPKYSVNQNIILISVNHLPPFWADRYKFVVKQNKGNYQTIYASIFYEEGLFTWIKLDGANKNKVKEGDTLIVKSDLNGALNELIKVKVLEVETKEEDFIEGNVNEKGDKIIEESGLYMKIKATGFDINKREATFLTYDHYTAVHRGRPHVDLGSKQGTFAGYFDSNKKLYADYEIQSGSHISIKFHNYEKDGYNKLYEKSFIVQENYKNFIEWWNAEVIDLGESKKDFSCRFIRNSNNSLWMYVEGRESGSPLERSKLSCQINIMLVEGVVIFETEAKDLNTNIFYETEQTFEIINNKHTGNIQNQNTTQPAIVKLDFFNCYVMGNGAESYRYKDDFNTNYLNIDLRPNSTSIEKFKEVRRYADLTYSAVYNENTNINGLNEFNLALANFKDDIDKKYGYIQKLYSRDTDLIIFQEDKVSKVLFNKNLLMNADGTHNVSSIKNILGQQIAYAGEYGISRNPESFAFDGFNIYFTDAKRGAVMRLGTNGLEEISSYGLKQFFRNGFKNSIDNKKIGALDPYFDQYTLHSSTEIISIPVNLNCSELISKRNFSGQLIINMDYGLLTGDAGFSYNVGSVPVKIDIEWDDKTYTTGIVNNVVKKFMFNKTKNFPKKAKIIITTQGNNATFTLSGICISGKSLTVISLILNDKSYKSLTMKSRYRWIKGNFMSSYKTYDSVFEEGEIDIFDVNNGIQGSDIIPANNSNILLESYNGINQTAPFKDDDTLGYLLCDTFYNENNYEDIIKNATFIDPNKTILPSGDIIKNVLFNFNNSNNKKYLYLIWDYTIKNKPPVAVDDNISVVFGKSKTFDLRINDYDPDGDPLTVIIDSQPLHGKVVVNKDNTVTYTNQDLDAITDSFTYHVNDGKVDSNIATVNLSVSISAGQSIFASGGNGIFFVPIIVGNNAGSLVVHFDALTVPDRLQILFDPNKNPKNITEVLSLPVVADTLYVGDRLLEKQDGLNNGTYTNLDLNVFNGSGFEIKKRRTEKVIITDSVVASNEFIRTDRNSNKPSRNKSSGVQIGVQNLVYTSKTDTTGKKGLNSADGNIALKYTKVRTKAYLAYIKVTSPLSSTSWSIYKTEFI